MNGHDLELPPSFGRRLEAIEEVVGLALARKSVISMAPGCGFDGGRRHVPAAVAQNWPAVVLLRLIERGLYEYATQAQVAKARR